MVAVWIIISLVTLTVLKVNVKVVWSSTFLRRLLSHQLWCCPCWPQWNTPLVVCASGCISHTWASHLATRFTWTFDTLSCKQKPWTLFVLRLPWRVQVLQSHSDSSHVSLPSIPQGVLSLMQSSWQRSTGTRMMNDHICSCSLLRFDEHLVSPRAKLEANVSIQRYR